jgi:hypothetical protein
MGAVESLAEKRAAVRLSLVAEAAEVAELTQKYSVAVVGGRARVIRWHGPALDMMHLDAFRALFEGRSCTIRTEDGDKRVPLAKQPLKLMTKYPALVYRPGAGPVVDEALNLWRGFAVAAAEDNWELMRTHLRDVVAGGDKVVDRYIMRWFALCVQNPDAPAEVALVFRGGKGSGKGVVGNALLKMFGPHGVHISYRKHLTGFNRHLLHCSFLFADEAYWPGDQSAESELKRMITEKTLQIEPKGCDSFEVPNCLHMLITGNADWVVPASFDERRFAVTDVSSAHVGDRRYFEALHAELAKGGAEAMLYELLTEPLGDWHPRQDVPQTSALDDQKCESIRGVDALVGTLLADGCLPFPASGHPDVCLTTGDAEGVGLWAYARKVIPSLRHDTPHSMARVLREKWSCERWKSGPQRGVKFPPLADMRQAFAAKYGKQKWDGDPGEDWG